MTQLRKGNLYQSLVPQATLQHFPVLLCTHSGNHCYMILAQIQEIYIRLTSSYTEYNAVIT